MKKFYAAWLMIVLVAVACSKDKVVDPGKKDSDKTPVEIPKDQFTTFEHGEWTYKMRTWLENTPAAVNARELLEKNLDEIDQLIPAEALKVMHRQPIWLEKDLTDGAAWYHASKEWLQEQGYMVEKWHCVELCNYVNYYSWSRQNQPYMVLHELCHLYHEQALTGGFENPDVKKAYNNAMKKGLYKHTPYRLDKNTVYPDFEATFGGSVYATTNQMEYFSEICEAYWGENDYFPFNYEDLKEYDTEGFALMEKVWGKRFAD